jgi:alkylation response protein AidB-like acyl-CoA dehydrogenase
VNFAFSDEQEQFRAALRRFLAERAPSAAIRRAMERTEGLGRDPWMREVWKQACAELGLAGIAIPERHGGQGFGCLEVGIVQEELGRALAPTPFFASVALAANAILLAGDEAEQARLLPGIAAGETRATLAVLEDSGRWDAEGIALVAARDGAAWRFEGTKRFVVDGAEADLLLVAARLPGTRGAEGIGLFTVRADEAGVTATPLDTLDPLRCMAHLELAGARAERVGPEGGCGPALEKTLLRAAVALAAEMSGAAARCLEMATEYARVRVQFGRPIGSFQAIQHKLAEVLLELELARSASWWASWVADRDGPELAEAAHLAKAGCAGALSRAAAENVQVHGGMGFTWEHDAQLFYKRARSADLLLGDASWHRSRLADRLLQSRP